jgi:hypothetical protein
MHAPLLAELEKGWLAVIQRIVVTTLGMRFYKTNPIAAMQHPNRRGAALAILLPLAPPSWDQSHEFACHLRRQLVTGWVLQLQVNQILHAEIDHLRCAG